MPDLDGFANASASPVPHDTGYLRVLLVEDSPADADLLLEELRRGGFAPSWRRVDSESAMASALAEGWDIVISDHAMPAFSSTRALRLLRRNDDDTPFIIVSGRIDEADAVEAMKLGAQDYISKDRLARLVPAVRRELRDAAVRRERNTTRALLQHSGAQYRLILDLCPDAIMIESGMQITFANQAAARLFGANVPDDLVGRQLLALVAEDCRSAVRDLTSRAAPGMKRRAAPAQWLRLDGSRVEAEAAASPFFVNDVPGTQLVLRPTPREVEPAQAPQDEGRSRPAAGSSAGRHRRLVYVLIIALLVFGSTFGLAEIEDVVAWSVGGLYSHFVAASLVAGVTALASYVLMGHRQRLYDLLVAENVQRREMERQVRQANKELERRVFERTQELGASNEKLRLELEQRQSAEKRLDFMAHYDDLTGIPNRALFADRLSAQFAVSRRDASFFSVLFLDLDRFKGINDTLGHPVGDELLRQVSTELRAVLRDADTVARLGGDEFALILPALKHKEDAAVVARKILNRFARPMRVGAHELYVTPSIGISVYPEDGDSADLLLKNADTAMYKAKEAGRNGYCFYSAEMNERALERLEMETALRRALDGGEFVLYYQPKFEVRGRSLAGAEALLRWQRHGHGLVSPAEFVPLLEETGLIQPVGAWVIREACRQIARWRHARALAGPVAVNVSARQFQTESLLLDIAAALEESAVPPAMLELEITETVLASHPADALATLRRIKSLGVKVAIDDFGTGYSSLGRLKEFPIDSIKLDCSFIRDIASDPADRHIVAMVIGLARGLGMQVVAEGVETEAQLAVLDELGCELMQGYLLARPGPADAMSGLFSSQASEPARAAAL